MIGLPEYIEILESKSQNILFDSTLRIKKYPKLYNKLKRYIKKNFGDIGRIYLIFKNAEEAQLWADFTYLDGIEGKFTDLDGNYSISKELYNKSEQFLNDVTNKSFETEEFKEKDFPFISITGFGNRIKIVFSNKMKVDKYNITAYLVNIG